MIVEVLAWAPDKKTWEQAITTTIVADSGLPLAAYAYDENGVQIMPPVLAPHPGLGIDEIGEIYQPAPVPPPGEQAIAVLAAPGWHINLRFHEPLSETITEGLAQVDEEGNPLPLWDRTNILTLFPDAVWHQDETGVPGGYVGTKSLKLFDPATVRSRTRVWA